MTEQIREFANYISDMQMIAPIKNSNLYSPLTTDERIICGVGINLSLVHDPPLIDTPKSGETYRYITIVDSVEYNSPAYKAGIRDGDIVAAVNDNVLEYDRCMYMPDDVADMIRGPEGSRVVVTMERCGERARYVLERVRLGMDVGVAPLSSPPTPMMVTPEGEERKRIGQPPMPVTPEGKRNLESFDLRLEES